MTYPPDWPAPGKMHFRLLHERLGALDLHCDQGYIVNGYNLGFPEVREVRVNNSLDDGAFDVTRFFGARAVSLDVTLKSHTGLTPASSYLNPEAVLRDRLLGYLYPGIRSRLLFSENGDRRVRQILIRGSSASLAVNQANYNKVNLSWIAPRGTLYSYDERCYGYIFSVTSDDAMTLNIVNEGTVPVDWRASISGYLVHPWLVLNGTKVLQLIYTAEPGDVIVLDSFSRTITINGKPASYTYGNNAPEWFTIPPGTSTLTIEHEHFEKQPGYPYAYWQEPADPPVNDDFERADGPLGAAWATPSVIPTGTVAVPLAIESGEVIVTVADDGAGPHEWGFARNTTAITGGTGLSVEVDVANLAQSSGQGPTARSKVELFTNMHTGDAACQALSVDFDFGAPADPVPPVIFEDPFETSAAWTVTGGGGVSIIPAGMTGSALQINGTAASLSYDIDVVDRSDIIVVGAAVRIVGATGVTGISSVRDLFEVRSSGYLCGKVAVDVGGSLYATDALGNNRGGSPAGAILPNVWYYVEVRYTLSDTLGQYALRIDGIDVGGAFDLDTSNVGAGAYDEVRIPPPNPVSGGTHQVDDLYIATGPDAVFVGPVNVPNGSLVWSLHQYNAGGATANTVASGSLPFDYTAAAVRLRLESGTDGEQRFVLNGTPVAAEIEAAPIVGTFVGFGTSYETITYDVETGGFSDDFERAALGTDWTLPVARATGKTVVLPTISTGAAVSAGHAANYPQQVYNATTTGTTLAGGVAQTMPPNLTAGYLCIARVLQDNPAAVPITASTGWTQVGTAVQGADVIRMSCFARICDGTSNDALTVTGAATNWVSAIESYWVQPVAPATVGGFAGSDIIAKLKFAAATGATGLADPPSIDLGGARDWLFLVSAGLDTATVPTMGASPGYTNIHGTTVSPGSLCAMRSAYRTATLGGTENPAAYTGTTGRPWIAFTVGLPPTSGLKWGGAEEAVHEFDAAAPITVEAVVNSSATGGPPMVELYTHMVHGAPACRVLQADLFARTWKLGHYAATGDDIVVAASGALPAGASPYTLRLESDPDGTERFLFNGALVQSVVDATAPSPTGATRVGFGEFSTTSFTPAPQVRSFTATGSAFAAGPPPADPTSPRIERFSGEPTSGTNWAIPPGTVPANNPAPGGKPPWAWTPPVDPLTGEPSILSVHFCYYDQWI